MKNKLIKLLTIVFAVVSLTGFIISAPAFAEEGSDCTNICDCSTASEEIKAAAGCPGTTAPAKIEDVVMNIVNGVLILLATVAVIVIIIGGVQYMTSTGDAGKVKKAKDTILYAVIGLVIVALAAVIVNFVIGVINKNTSPDTSTSGETSLVLFND